MAANGNNHAEDPDPRNENVLEDAVDQLAEKRASTRESAMQTLIKEFRNTFNWDFIDKRRDTLTEAIKKGLKKGGPTEQELSSQMLSLLIITLGMESEDIFKSVTPVLEEALKNATSDQVKSAIIESIAIGTFVTSDEKTSIDYLKILSKIFEDPASSELLKAAAIFGWSLILTSVSKKYIYDTIIPDHLENLQEFLKGDSLDLRMDAGEAIALLIEVARDVEAENFSIENLSGYVEVEELLDTLFELAQDKNKQRSRKEKLKQKQIFKEIRDFVETGALEPEEIEIKHQKLTFDTWTSIKQLEAFRDVLGTGFHSHFESNELLQQVFDLFINVDKKKASMTALEKRFLMSPSSPAAKAKTKSLNKQRSIREKATDSFIAGDDD